MAERKYHSIDEITYNGKPLGKILEAHRIWVESGRKKGTRADLIQADLRGANLSRAFLGGVVLRRAFLGGANLSRADLRQAVLDGANLSGADLREANLSYAYLSEADLRGADLSWANLSGADLLGAKLQKAIVGLMTIGDCDMSGVIGLETVHHIGASSIGVDTIFKSQGKIPEAFLRGAGVPGIFITYVKSLVANPIEFYSCFISHSSQDKDFCDRLYADLKAKDVRCWYFPEDATWGKSVWGEIDASIRIYDKLVVVCSEHSLQSGPVIREIERALQREDKEKREVLFPIRIDDYLFEKWDHPRKADVVAKVVGDFRTWKDHEQYKKNFDKLLKALNRQSEPRA